MTATPSPNGQRRRPGRRDPREGLDSNVAPDVAGLPARLVMEAIPDMAALCDADGTVTYVNPALAALLWEVGPSGAAPDSLALAARAYRPDGTLYDPRELPLHAAARTRRPQRDVEILFRLPDGTARLTVFNATPLRDADGRFLGAVAVGRDVTGEVALAQAREDWLATAAHDLRGPVTAILGNLQLAMRTLGQLAAAEAGAAAAALPRLRRNIELAEARTRDLVRQMDSLLDASAAAAGAFALHPEPGTLDLAALAEEAVSHTRSVTTRHAVELEVRARPAVSGDPIRLQQVLQNLLANAVKYSPDTGTIRVVVEERAGADPCPGAHHSGGAPPPGAPGARWAVVTVEDNGFGIPAPDVPHVFERYRRASCAASRVRGTGLGLYSSRAIAEAHGGRLCIERTASVEEAGGQGWHGTVMALALPLTEQPPGGDEASADEGGGAGAARHEAPGRKRAEVAQ